MQVRLRAVVSAANTADVDFRLSAQRCKVGEQHPRAAWRWRDVCSSRRRNHRHQQQRDYEQYIFLGSLHWRLFINGDGQRAQVSTSPERGRHVAD